MSLRLAALIAVAWPFASTTQAPAQQDDALSGGVVEAQKFVLKDEDGTVRAEIGMNRGGPHVSLLNPDGTVGVTLNLERTGRGLAILGPNGKEQIAMGKVTGQPTYYLTITSSNGHRLFSVPAATTQNPSQDNPSRLIAAAIVVAGVCVGVGVYFGLTRRSKRALHSGT